LERGYTEKSYRPSIALSVDRESNRFSLRGLDPRIHVLAAAAGENDVNGRDKPGQNGVPKVQDERKTLRQIIKIFLLSPQAGRGS
jgi:hypothetical protein